MKYISDQKCLGMSFAPLKYMCRMTVQGTLDLKFTVMVELL